jgi:glycosyltransferase involved in cell wall biosynthesis
MKILLLAPHPFYQARGTPIAVDLVLRVLSERGDTVDVVTYVEGEPVDYSGVKLYRIPRLPFIRNIRPGFSWKKVICDVFLLVEALRLVRQNQYDVIHAGEEAVFIGLFFKNLFKLPYVYDMDSSLAQQIVEKYAQLSFCKPLLDFFEGIAVRNAEAVVSVCDALAEDIRRYKPRKVVVIPDISLLNYVSSRVS